MAWHQRRRASRARRRGADAVGDPDRAAARCPILRVYLDSSAFVSGLLREPRSTLVERAAPPGSPVATSAVAYVEVRAALAAAGRAKRFGADRLAEVRRDFERTWDQVDAVDVDDALVRAAGDVAEAHGLRAGDAIHLASALSAGDVRLLTFDKTLLRAAADAGVTIIPID